MAREVEAAEAARDLGAPDALVVVDGPLSGRQHIAGAIGVIKTHGVAYLPPDLHRLVGRLEPGARTPVFAIGGRWSRYSWYLRLPGGVDAPWAGVVRVECSTEISGPGAIQFADSVGVTISRYASEPYKDPRAPQNLIRSAGWSGTCVTDSAMPACCFAGSGPPPLRRRLTARARRSPHVGTS